jgi:hypothetical protein
VSLPFIRPQAKAWGYTYCFAEPEGYQACLHRLRTAHFHKETVLHIQYTIAHVLGNNAVPLT